MIPVSYLEVCRSDLSLPRQLKLHKEEAGGGRFMIRGGGTGLAAKSALSTAYPSTTPSDSVTRMHTTTGRPIDESPVECFE